MWKFVSDDIERIAFAENVFTPEECDSIISMGKRNLQEATVINNSKTELHPIRISKVNFFMPNVETEWMFRKMTDVITNVNSRFFNFDLDSLPEGMQFTEYTAPTGHYNFHVDRLYKGMIRKLSVVVQLTDPSEYDGGELQIYDGGDLEKSVESLGKQRGSVWFFPSWMLHRVTELKRGTRHSLVLWASGPRFK